MNIYYRPRLRDGAAAIPGHRRPCRHPRGRAGPPALPEARHRRLLPDPSRRRHHGGVPGLSRAAPSDDGPDQGRHALLARSRDGRGGRARDLDELEMRARRPALWRGEGRRRGRSAPALRARARERRAPLHAGDDPLRRPADRRDGARHGHGRADHGLVHGHLLHVPGPDGDRDRHRQAGRAPAARWGGARRPGAASCSSSSARWPGSTGASTARPRSCRASAMSARSPRRRSPSAARR